MSQSPLLQSRREALRVLAAALCAPLMGSVLPACGGGDALKTLRLKEDRQVQVLLVPGFLSELFECFSLHAAGAANEAIRRGARALNEVLNPIFPDGFLGDHLAGALEPVEFFADGALITFAPQAEEYTERGIDFTNIDSPGNRAQYGFDSLAGVARNGEAIAAFLRAIEAAEEKSIVVLSHGKGGLDVLDALLRYPSLWDTTLTGWVSLQAPFHGSPVADPYTLAPGIGDVLFEVLGGEGAALDDLTTNARFLYMSEHADEIAALTAAVPVLSAASKYEDGNPVGLTMFEMAARIFDDDLAGRIVDLVVDNVDSFAGEPVRIVTESVREGVELIAEETRKAVEETLPLTGLLDETNARIRVLLGEPNDGLVSVASTLLPGAESMLLEPDCDHAAPVMLVSPFREFWSPQERSDAIEDALGRVRQTEVPQ